MSYVSSVVIAADYLGPEELAYIRSYQHRGNPIRLVEPDRCGNAWGGEKCAEAAVLLGAFNCLDVEQFVAHMHAMKFLDPVSLTIMTNGEHTHVSFQNVAHVWVCVLDELY